MFGALDIIPFFFKKKYDVKSRIVCSGETLFFKMIAPLSASPAPAGGGGAWDSSILPNKPTLLCTGNMAQSSPGAPQRRGQSPRERQMV